MAVVKLKYYCLEYSQMEILMALKGDDDNSGFIQPFRLLIFRRHEVMMGRHRFRF